MKRFVDRDPFVDVAAEQLKERLVVDELRRLVGVNLKKVVEDLLLHTLDPRRVVPQLIEPPLEILPVAVVVHDQVEFDIIVGRSKAETAGGEIGAAEDSAPNFPAADVRHFAMQKSGFCNRANFDFFAYPCGAGAGEIALVEPAGERQTIVTQHVGGPIFLVWIDRLDERRFAEQETNLAELVQLRAQLVVGKNREVGRNEIEIGTSLEIMAQKIGDAATRMVVPYPGGRSC